MAKQPDSDIDSDSQNVESVLQPFPQIKTPKAFKTITSIANNKRKNTNAEMQYVDNSSSASSSLEPDNHLLNFDFTSVSKNQKRDIITEVMKTKRMRKEDTVKDFEEIDKENLHSYIFAGTCIFIIIIYFMIIYIHYNIRSYYFSHNLLIINFKYEYIVTLCDKFLYR